MRLRFAMFPGIAAVVWAVLAAPRICAQTPPGLGLHLNPGITTLSVTGDIGSPLTLQFTTNLATGPWIPLTNRTLTTAVTQFTDPASPAQTRYYRTLIVAPTNMNWIPPGAFVMGSPTNELERSTGEIQHTVTLTRGFFTSKYLVTQANYLSLLNTNPSYFTPANGFSPDLNRPVEQVSWMDATNYCGLLTQQERAAGRIFTNWTYRLPTEAEWEFACRAGTTTPFYYGSDLHTDMADFRGQYEYIGGVGTVFNPDGTALGRTVAVGNYQPNNRGLYDMVGNVWEWCQDWFGNYTTNSLVDPQGPGSGTARVFRGGAFNVTGRDCRSAGRSSYLPSENANTIGFRVVLSGP